MLILHSLQHEPMHGYAIAQRIKLLSQEVLAFKEGTLYPALHALEADGAIESFLQVVAGRERKYYHITEKGLKQLAKEQEQWQAFTRAVGAVLQG